MKEKVVLLVVGGLGTTAKDLDKSLKAIGIVKKIAELKKTVLIHIKSYCGCEESC